MATLSSSSSPATQIMLAIDDKKTTAVDLYRPLRNYIVYNYSEREAQNLEDDLQTLKQYRTDIERSSPSDSLSSRRDLLISYFRALTAIESRFPISPETDHINTLTFVCHDAFKNKLKASQQNIHLEKAAVLFNLGAVHSQLGLGFDRREVEGRKNASHLFMKAAGVFAFLRDNVAMKACMGSSNTVDVSVECVGMLERLMLAQAQECVFENAIEKGSSASVCSKISRQVGIFYEEALAALKVAPLSQHFEKAWHSHVQLKAALFYAEACYRYGLELHEKDEIGEEIARLKSGINALSEARKSSPKGAAQQLIDAYNILEGNLNRNLERAVKENDRVYLMRVPPASSLQPLPAFQMVKSMPMTEVFDASKEKMFASLVPDSSARALSRYTEMVDDVIRTQAEILQQGSELTRVRLKEMVSVASAGEFSTGKSDSLSTELSNLKLDFFNVFNGTTPRKPTCLYFTQGCCTMMDQGDHMDAHTHGFLELNTKSFDLSKVQPQDFDYFLVLDLEGNIEILEFPVLLIDAKTLELVDFFHRFVRPRKLRKERLDQNVEQHFGKFGINSIWHETAITFKDVIPQLEDWLAKHNVLTKELGGHLNKAAFITCGNWDIKTKIPDQCKVSRMELPPYFMEWINLKDIYLNFYGRRGRSMPPMMGQLQMPLVGNHHLGIDDASNITRILQRLIVDGSVLQITARRNSDKKVEFLFENRIW